MKIQQVLVLNATESQSKYYSWQSYVNERLRGLTIQPDVSNVRMLSMDLEHAVITYFVEIDE